MVLHDGSTVQQPFEMHFPITVQAVLLSPNLSLQHVKNVVHEVLN